MQQPGPVMMTPDDAALMRRILRRKIRGSGCTVTDTPDGVTVVVPPARPTGVSAGGGPTIVRVKPDGGSAGSTSSACSFTYSIFPLSATLADIAANTGRLAESVPVDYRPVHWVQYVAATTGSYGLAQCFLHEGAAEAAWHLFQVFDEYIGIYECPETP